MPVAPAGNAGRRTSRNSTPSRVVASIVAAAVICFLPQAGRAQNGAPAGGPPVVDWGRIVGPDDGYGLVVTASSDGRGSLEMCGCGRTPLGGLPRRVAYERAVLDGTSGGAALFRVDAGGAFDDTIDTGRNEVIPHIRDEWVLRGYAAQDFAAINVAPSDLHYLSQMNVVSDRPSRLEKFPMLGRVISANVVPESRAIVEFQPYLIRTVASTRVGERPLRVGFIGVTQPPDDAASPRYGYAYGDPVKAVSSVLPKVRAEADLIVVLYHGPMARARALSRAIPGLDLVFVANTFLPDAAAAAVEGRTLIVPVVVQARSLAEVRGLRSGGGEWKFAARSTVLDSGIPSDRETLDMVYAARLDYIR